MYPIKGKLPAFSLIELLVVMVLSSIMVGIIYFAYYTVYTYQSKLSKKKQIETDICILYFTLKKDFENSKVITALGPYQVRCAYGTGKLIEYSVNDTFILRTQNERVDTFYCKTGTPSVFLGQNKVDTYPAVINRLEFEWEDFSNQVYARVVKQYDASSLMEITRKDSLP